MLSSTELAVDSRPILLVEDDPRERELTVAAIRACESTQEVLIARDGEEALDYLYARGVHAARIPPSPAVILMDLKLPKVNGLEVLQQIKSDPTIAATPVVMLTSSRDPRDVARSYALGANAHVIKPLDFDEFVDAMQDVTRFWTRRDCYRTPCHVPSMADSQLARQSFRRW